MDGEWVTVTIMEACARCKCVQIKMNINHILYIYINDESTTTKMCISNIFFIVDNVF